jgi:hypothetical protein
MAIDLMTNVRKLLRKGCDIGEAVQTTASKYKLNSEMRAELMFAFL